MAEPVAFHPTKRFRLTTDKHEEAMALQQQILPISPVDSTFRTHGDQFVPSAESKKEPTKSVKWNEQVQTVRTVGISFHRLILA